MPTLNPETTHPSTGPKTEPGKFESSKNALKHGLTSESIHRFPLEIREAYTEFLALQYGEFNPESLNECDYLEQYAFNRFQLNRAQPLLAQALDALTLDPANEALEKRYARLTRHVRALERSAQAALHELRTFITDRLLSAELNAQLAKEIPNSGLAIPTAFPSHRLLETKQIKRTPANLTLRFVKDQIHRAQAATTQQPQAKM